MAPPTHSCFTFLLLLALLVVTITPSSAEAPSDDYRCNLDDKKVLRQIGKDLGGYWSSYTYGCCAWPGVACDVNGRVYDLYIDGNDGPISIPASITGLRFLTTLEFHKNPNLTGPIPSFIGELTNLTFLRLDWNALSGPIPSFLGRLTSLTYLSLAFNNFSGSIPPVLGNLPLAYIRLDRNRLTGPIPASLAKLPSTYGLYLSHNNLTGPIPSSFAHTSITIFDFSRNQLSGDPSPLFGAKNPVTDLDLSRNNFHFDLTKVVFPQNLSTLDLNHNMVYGSIPKQIVTLTGLYGFNVSYNRLCGEIPSGGRLSQLDQYSFFHNKCLCGSPLAACKKN